MTIPTFKVIRPFDVEAEVRRLAQEKALAEKAAAKELKRKKQSDELDAHFAEQFKALNVKTGFAKGTKFRTSDTKIDALHVFYEKKFDSSKGVKDKYTVRVARSGLMSCNCMGWSIMKDTHRACTHCDELINELRALCSR